MLRTAWPLIALLVTAVGTRDVTCGRVPEDLRITSKERAKPESYTSRRRSLAARNNSTPRSGNWEHSSNLASKEIKEIFKEEAQKARNERRCPKVYIYDIPELWDYDKSTLQGLSQVHPAKIWGKPCNDGTFRTNQYTMPIIVIYRLLRSKVCKPTTDPSKADLFLVPAFPSPKIASHWDKSCKSVRDLSPYLTHMTQRNAHRHFFLAGKGHKNMRMCDWWRKPQGLLARAMRISYSEVVHGEWNNLTTTEQEAESQYGFYGPYDSQEWPLKKLQDLQDKASDNVLYPHSYSVPYPSAVHWHPQAGKGPWESYHKKRNMLASFIGAVHGNYGMDVRKKIIDDCERVGEPRCHLVNMNNRSLYNFPSKGHCALRKHKGSSIFCLEPGGDSPYRKSLSDDILLGCIPVVFSPYLQIVDPWHWGPYRHSSQVVVDRDSYLSGRIDLFEHLQNLVDTGVASKMRHAIAMHGHSFQYALADYPGDAVETLILGAHMEARRRERKGPELRRRLT